MYGSVQTRLNSAAEPEWLVCATGVAPAVFTGILFVLIAGNIPMSDAYPLPRRLTATELL
jgi:hypothetical protein